jgi:hypothetical protein
MSTIHLRHLNQQRKEFLDMAIKARLRRRRCFFVALAEDKQREINRILRVWREADEREKSNG